MRGSPSHEPFLTPSCRRASASSPSGGHHFSNLQEQQAVPDNYTQRGEALLLCCILYICFLLVAALVFLQFSLPSEGEGRIMEEETEGRACPMQFEARPHISKRAFNIAPNSCVHHYPN